MIKAVLLDLDDTLVISQTMEMFAAYLKELGQYSERYGSPDMMAHQVMAAYEKALRRYDPAHTLMDRFFSEFTSGLGVGDTPAVRSFYERFYIERYPDVVRKYVKVQPGAASLLPLLVHRGLKIVIATNPVLPEIAAMCRLEEGGLPPHEYPIEFITSLGNMHFGKPQPEYYEEILLRLDVESGEALMVGDSWEHDIVPARTVGLNTYWVTGNEDSRQGLNETPINGSGTIKNLISLTESGWLKRLEPPQENSRRLNHRLAAFPASVYTLIADYPDEVLACKLEDSVWSVRDILCHLCDHEREEDRVLLQRIVSEENPFLSGNYNPWDHTDVYTDTSAREALEQFVQYRAQTVEWVNTLSDDVWAREARHAIFGKTSFGEMVRFATEHDRTHYRQMIGAIQRAVEVCS